MDLNLIVMCGIQCSGKSTRAKELAEKYNAVIISSDSLREHYPNFDNAEIFRTVYMLMNIYLRKNKNVLIDATNINLKTRRRLFTNIRVKCNKICYVINTPLEKCIERLHKRNESDYPHKIDESVLQKYSQSFQMPTKEEGFDEIIIETF
ncbi:MAG: ATP-binding protein [Clostridia bacterium]|nr:ATP-binding protein [Clostridia bacterium]